MAGELTVNKPPAGLIFVIGARHSERLESQINFFFCWIVVFAGLVSLAINIYQRLKGLTAHGLVLSSIYPSTKNRCDTRYVPSCLTEAEEKEFD